MRSRDSLLLEFEQLLNFLYPVPASDLWRWKSGNAGKAIQSFCRDATALIPRDELHAFAVKQWLPKRGLSARQDVKHSLEELLQTEIPLRI